MISKRPQRHDGGASHLDFACVCRLYQRLKSAPIPGSPQHQRRVGLVLRLAPLQQGDGCRDILGCGALVGQATGRVLGGFAQRRCALPHGGADQIGDGPPISRGSQRLVHLDANPLVLIHHRSSQRLLGRQAAFAVENSRLLRTVERRTNELAMLHRASVAVSSTLEMRQVLKTLAEQVGHALDASSVYICNLDETMTQSTVLAKWLNPEVADRISVLGTIYLMEEHPATLRALTEQRPLVVQAADPGSDPADRQSAQLYGWTSRLNVPLVTRGRTVGYVEVRESRCERLFTEEEVRLCQTIATDAATAIEHARLFQAEQEQRAFAEALEEAAAVVSATLNLDQVLDRILQQVARVVPGDAFNVMLIEEGKARVVRWRGYERWGGEDKIAGLSMPISAYPILAEMVQTGRPVIVKDTAQDSRWVPTDNWLWLKCYVSAPILVTGETVGFLNVDGAQPDQFGPADAQRLEAFAHHAAIAIENARLFRDALHQTDELQIALARLEQADQLKNQFIQNVSHELRQPLALIRGYAELLAAGEMGRLTSEQRGPIDIITRRARMLGDLVQDITLILEAEAHRPSQEPVAFDTLARAAVEDFQVITQQIGLTLEADIASDCPPVVGEASYLRRVLDNLVGNALKFTPQGGTVTVRLWPEEGQVYLQVSDTGIGIPPRHLPRIFERFYQVDGSARRRYGGVGLGLALVKEIIESFAGTVSVESKMGEGSTFTVTLPVYQEGGQD